MATEETTSTLSLTEILSSLTKLILGLFMVVNFVSLFFQVK